MEPQQQATCESAIQLGDLTINARGGKYVPLRRNGGPPVWQSAEWQKIIWHPAAFNDPTAKRVGLCLEPDEASTAQLQEIEQHLVRALTALSLSEPKVFGKFLTETDVQDRFQSCLKTSPRGGSYLKLKLDWGRVRIWGPNQEELAEPGDLAGRECKVRCELRQVWVMSNQCGLLLEVTDLQLKAYEAAVQDDLLGAHFGHVHVDALGDAAAGSDELQAGPDPHGLRHVGGRRAGAGVLDRDSFRRGQAAVVPGVDADAVGVGDDEADVRLALPREPFPGRLERLGQGLLPGLVDPHPGQEVEDARVAPHVLRELVVPAVGEVVEQLAVLELPLHRGAREVVHDRGELAEVAEQQELDFAVHGDAGDVVPQPRVELRDLFRHQPVDVAVPVPDGAPRPVVGRLRLHAEVLHGGVGLRDDLDLVPFFPEGGHDLARQVGFPGARIARQQQASAFEAVEHGVFRDLPVHRAAVRTLGLDWGDPVLALEALDLLAPIHGRAVGMPFADQAVHEALELFGQVLEDDAVRLHGLQVPRRHGGKCIPDAADRDVLRGHHEVVHGPTAPT